MGILSKLITSSGSSVIDSLGNAIDKTTSTFEEKQTLKNELAKIMQEAEVALSQEVTKRWESDNRSGTITRLFRPVISTLMILTFLYLLVLGSPTDIQVHYLFSLVEIIIISYFGGRTLEKTVSIIKGDGTMKTAVGMLEDKPKVGFFKKIFTRKKKDNG